MSDSDHSPAPDKPEASAESPPLIPGHQLLRRIAHGSYGEIWLARTDLGAFRAVKIIRRSSFADARPYDREFAGIQRYEPISREHAGLVDILQVGRDEPAGFFCYVMELADNATARSDEVMGDQSDGAEIRPHHSNTPPLQLPESYSPLTLAEVIHQRQRLPASEVVEIGIRLAQALDFLHSRRLVHRDVKPSNIIFVDGQPKLADVGLIADLGSPQSLVGTEGYIPPEGPGSAQADIYSLGKVLYEAATGKDRQEFPDLPTRLGEGHDDPALPELNEVLLKACENNPRARYFSAAQMVADLQRLKAGQSLRARRAGRQRRRSIASGVGAALGVALAGISLFAVTQHYLSKPRLLLCEHFDAQYLDTNLWTRGHEEPWTPESGRRFFQAAPSGGELVLQAKADHEAGWSAIQSVWVDLNRDLRQLGPCRIELELAGQATNGGFAAVISDTNTLPQSTDPCGARLIEFDASRFNEPAHWPAVWARMDLYPACEMAVVYPDTNRLDQFDVVDLSALPAWRLRLFCFTSTSKAFAGGKVDFRIREIRVCSNPNGEVVAGRVVAWPSEWPVADAVIKDRQGRILPGMPKTCQTGAFAVPRSRANSSLMVERDGYTGLDGHTPIIHAANRFITVQLRKLMEEPGDPVAAISYGDLDVHSIGFRDGTLNLLVQDSRTAFRLLPVDVTAPRVAPVRPDELKRQFPTNAVIIGFVECGSRLVGISAWPGVLFDLGSDPPRPLLSLKHRRDASTTNTVNCPRGAAFDGSSFWFIEAENSANQRFGLHTVDLERGAAVNFLSSNDKQMQGLAWDGQFFWISSARGKVYRISPEMAMRNGTVEGGIGREFPGHYSRLAFGQRFLWGLEPEKHRVCKIKLTN